MDVATARKSRRSTSSRARKYAYASWTPDGGRLLLHAGSRPTAPSRTPTARLRRDPLPQARRRTRRRTELVHEKTGDPTTFIGARASRRTATGSSLTIEHGWTRATTSTSWTSHASQRSLDAARRGARTRSLSVEAFNGPLLRHAPNEGAPRYARLRRGPRAPRAERAGRRSSRSGPTRRSTARSVVGGRLSLRYLKDVTSATSSSTISTASSFARVALPDARARRRPQRATTTRTTPYYSFESFNYPYEIHETSSSRRARRTLWYKHQGARSTRRRTPWSRSSSRRKDGTRVPHVHRPREGPAEGRELARPARRLRRLPASPQTWRSPRRSIPWLERGGIYARGQPPRRQRSTARSGTGTGCATRSRTSSTTSSPPPST